MGVARGTQPRSCHGGLCWNKLNAQQWAVDRAVLCTGLRAQNRKEKKENMVEDLYHPSATPDVIMRNMHGTHRVHDQQIAVARRPRLLVHHKTPRDGLPEANQGARTCHSVKES